MQIQNFLRGSSGFVGIGANTFVSPEAWANGFLNNVSKFFSEHDHLERLVGGVAAAGGVNMPSPGAGGALPLLTVDTQQGTSYYDPSQQGAYQQGQIQQGQIQQGVVYHQPPMQPGQIYQGGQTGFQPGAQAGFQQVGQTGFQPGAPGGQLPPGDPSQGYYGAPQTQMGFSNQQPQQQPQQ